MDESSKSPIYIRGFNDLAVRANFVGLPAIILDRELRSFNLLSRESFASVAALHCLHVERISASQSFTSRLSFPRHPHADGSNCILFGQFLARDVLSFHAVEMREFHRDHRRSEASDGKHRQIVKDVRHVSYPFNFVCDGHVDRGHREVLGGRRWCREFGLRELAGRVCGDDSNSRCPKACPLKSHLALNERPLPRSFFDTYRDPAYSFCQLDMLVFRLD